MTTGATYSWLGAAALVAVAAVAIAGLSMALDADTWAAYAQSDPVTVKVGAMLAPANGSEFQDDYRQAAIEYAVAEFNRTNSGVKLDLTVYPYVRNETVNADENRTLIEAYAGGNGPRFYVGPTTSQGLENLRGNSTTRGYLDNDNVLLITPSSEAPQLAMPDDNIFRLAFNVERQGTILVDEMKSDNIMSYVTVARNDAWGTELAEHVNERATQAGMTQRGDTILFKHNMTAAYWEGIRNMVNASVGTVTDGTRVGVFFLGYDNAYPNMSSVANSSDALRDGTAWYVPSTTINARLTIDDGAMRDFSAAVNLTALSQDVESNSVTMAIDRLVNRTAEFYDYAAYDSVFVLGNAMRMAVEAGENASDVATVEKYMAHAAMNYDGAALGNSLLLDGNGDLLAPDKFTVHTAMADGSWDDGGESSSTVTRIGALVALGSTYYDDDKAWEAMREAAADYNADAQESLVKLIAYDITDPSDSDGYVAAGALERAYAGGNGPSVYIGPSLSTNVEAVLPYATANDILLLGYASESESLSLPDDNLFRTAISTARHGHFMAQVMADANVSSVVTVILDDAWGRSLNSSIAEALVPNGLQSAGVVTFAPGSAASAVDGIATAIAGTSNAGVAFVGVRTDQDAMAAAALANATLTGVPWFVTPTGYYADMNTTTRSFAQAVNMTAIVLDVEDSAKKSALDARVQGLDFYGYSAYDGVFVLGNAIGSVVESGKTSGINATDLGREMHAAADAYEGILGDIVLNTNGDLRSPDRFAVWQVNSSGVWADTGVRKQTPIVEVGALMAIDSTDYADNKAWEALQRAAFDYNGAGERAAYLNLTLYDITNKSDRASYDAAGVLTRAYSGGSGPSVYVGPSLSSNVELVLEYARTNNITLLGFASEAESLAVADDHLFRTAISTARHGHFMAQVMADANVRSVVTVIRDDAWGQSMNSSIVEALAANGLRSAGVVTFAPGSAASAVGDIATAIASTSNAGVAFVGVRADQDAMAAAALANATLTGVPWFVTPSGYYADMSSTTRDFAKAVNLRAIVLDIEDNAKKSALDAKVSGLDFYSYSAYDSLFVLGNAFESAATENNKAAVMVTAAELQGAIPGAADAYVGVLGDISLNSKGDLRSPDRFAVWQVDAGTGMWTDTGDRRQTPIVEIGAITIREGARFDDTPRFVAMNIAVDEYNREAEDGGALYLNLREVRTSLSPGSVSAEAPGVLAAVRAASAGADGIKYFVGPSTSGNSKRVLEFANENGLTLISPSSTAPSLAIENDSLFRLVPNDATQGKVVGEIVHNHQSQILADLINGTSNNGGERHEHVIMVVRNDTWGQGLNASTSDWLTRNADIVIERVLHNEADADWNDTAMELNDTIARLRADAPGDPIAVLHIGFPGDFISLAAQNSTYPSIGNVTWFGTDGIAGASQLIDNDTARQFAEAVSLTATKFDVDANAKFNALTAALESRGVQSRTIYEYSAYDSVYVMARAIESAISAKGASSYTPADVREMVRAAASGYDGALGNIELNTAGDLRSPNSYAAWEVKDGAWAKADTHESTPVFDIGALLMLDNNPSYTDDDEKTAMDLAVDDFNTEHELIGDFYIRMAVQRISISPTDTASPDPDALAGLQNAYANGTGPSYYVGPSTSGNSKMILEYANENEIVVISHSSTAPALAIADDYLFRMTVPDSLQGRVLANLIGQEGSITDLVIVVRDDVWGQGVEDSTKSSLESAGSGTAVTRVTFPPAEADWDRVARELAGKIGAATDSAATKTDGKVAVLFAGFPGDFNAVVSRSSSDMQLGGVAWFGADGVGNSNEVTSNSTAVEFAKSVNLTTVVYTVQPNDINKRINPAAVYGPSAYDAVYVLGNAMKAAYGDDRMPPTGSAVKNVITNVTRDYVGALGNTTLNDNGDLDSPASYGIHNIDDETDMWSLIRGMLHDGVEWQEYDIDPDTNAWSLSTGDIPLCGITLDNDEEPVNMGNVNVGATSADVQLTIMRGGSAPVSSVNITATPWTATSGATSGATVLGPGATKVVTDAANPAGNPLSSPVIITDLGAEKVIVLRLDTTGASPTTTVDIQQIVMYTATCGSP